MPTASNQGIPGLFFFSHYKALPLFCLSLSVCQHKWQWLTLCYCKLSIHNHCFFSFRWFFKISTTLIIIKWNEKFKSEKWNISCHINKQGCHNHQQFQPSSVNCWVLRAFKKKNTCYLCISVIKLCPTLCEPMDCSLPGYSSSVHGIFQARILEWVAISFSSLLSNSHQIAASPYGEPQGSSECEKHRILAPG